MVIQKYFFRFAKPQLDGRHYLYEQNDESLLPLNFSDSSMCVIC